MNLKEIINRISILFPKPPAHTEDEKKERERRIVARYAQGNISLQLGKYLTEKDIERRKAKLSSYRF